MDAQLKSIGQIFTPEPVANFMIDISAAHPNTRILEPSCGEGVFLRLLAKRGFNNAIGYEIDTSLKLDPALNIKRKSFIGEEFHEKFDLVIGNPPYIRWKHLDSTLKGELALNPLWDRYFNSLCDYLYLFILKSVELLKTGGELIFITPEYWVGTMHSQSLRDYLCTHGYFERIFHFNETPIFENVNSSILIFKFIKSSTDRPKTFRLSRYESRRPLDSETLQDLFHEQPHPLIRRFDIPQFSVKSPWILADQEVQLRLARYEKSCNTMPSDELFDTATTKPSTLGDIAEIGNGLVSGLDRAFQLPSNLELSDEEQTATLKVLKAKSLLQYRHEETVQYIFLNGLKIDEDDLRLRFPNFSTQLERYRTQLDERYQYKREIKYWEWVFLRNFSLFSTPFKKIFVPCKERISSKQFIRFSIVESGIYPTQDVTAIFLKSGVRESIYYILALLNSSRTFDWIKHKGLIKGNIAEFSEKPLQIIPIRRIVWNDNGERSLHDEITSVCKEYVEAGNAQSLVQLDNLVDLLF